MRKKDTGPIDGYSIQMTSGNRLDISHIAMYIYHSSQITTCQYCTRPTGSL